MGKDEPNRWAQMKELMIAVLELAPNERDAFIDGACDDESLKSELRSQLRHQDEADVDGFLNTPAVVKSETITFANPLHSTNRKTDPDARELNIRCPHCHNQLKLSSDADLHGIDCPSCGSQFNVVDDVGSTVDADQITTIGHFKLVQRLGMGGFGTVWKARDTVLDRTVAVKIPRRGLLTTEEEEKFFREARAAAQLNHTNIVDTYEVGRHEDVI